MESALLDANATAALLGLSEITVRRLVADRQIPFIRIRSSVRFPVAALMKWIEDKQIPAERGQHASA
jgi:excisionase family DNA binding protein